LPVSKPNLEPPLLLAFEGLLIGIELFDDWLFARLVRCGGHVLEDDCDAVIPSPVFGRVISRLHSGHAEYSPGLNLFLEYRKVILLEQPDELIGVAPLGLVVVLGDEWFRTVCLCPTYRRRAGKDHDS